MGDNAARTVDSSGVGFVGRMGGEYVHPINVEFIRSVNEGMEEGKVVNCNW